MKVAIPTALRLDAIRMSLADVIAKCKYRQQIPNPPYPPGRQRIPRRRVGLQSVGSAFTKAREVAGITGDDAPTFHEIRSLSKRLYLEQGGVDTRALLGHLTDAMSDLYANSRGLEPIKVKISAA